MSPPNEPPSAVAMFTRWVRGLLPPVGGGPPPIVTAARSRLSSWVAVVIALVVGAAAGFVLVLVAMGLPDAPAALTGFAAGVFVGVAGALVLASRSQLVRRGGAIALLLLPLLVLAAPFLLIAGGIDLLRRTSPRAPEAEPTPAPTEARPATRRRARRKKSK
jgi:hypothetical protein